VGFLKYCDICGSINLKENNFCIHCGCEFVSENICPHCGEINQNNALFCIKCNNQINPLAIDSFDTLFSDYNKNLLLNAQISDIEYNELLSNIFMRADYIEIYGDSVKNKILNFAGIFTRCIPKSRGYERGFIFANGIYYDDRLDDSVQIATIIHELSHYLLSSIIENLLCKIFKVKSSSCLQSFVWYFLTLPEFKIMNEYCAHTVEGRFIPYGYQNYGTFNALVSSAVIDDDSLDDMVIFGNTFANEIIVYLEKYIDEELREEIKIQYRKDLSKPTYDSIFKETNDSLPLNLKNKVLINILYNVFESVSKSSDDLEELESIKESIES
jgi:hypothetical protein